VLSDVAAAPDREARAPNRRRRAAGAASQRTLPSPGFRRFRQRATYRVAACLADRRWL